MFAVSKSLRSSECHSIPVTSSIKQSHHQRQTLLYRPVCVRPLASNAVLIVNASGKCVAVRSFGEPGRSLPTTATSQRSIVAAGPSASTASATTTTSTVATAASTSATAVASHLREARIDLLIGLLQYLYELTRLLDICNIMLTLSLRHTASRTGLTVSSEESDGGALAACTSCTADTVDVVL